MLICQNKQYEQKRNKGGCLQRSLILTRLQECQSDSCTNTNFDELLFANFYCIHAFLPTLKFEDDFVADIHLVDCPGYMKEVAFLS